MPRPEHFGAWCLAVGVAVFLCLPLMTAGAWTSAAPMQEMSASAKSPVAAQSTPMASDGMPCALCCIDPAPSAHTTTSEGKEPELATRWARAQPIPSTVRFLAAESSRVRVPIRITLCRCLN